MIAFHCAPSRGTLCDVTTHRRTALPTFIPPMLATLVAAPFDSEDWTFEIKWDGFRVEAVIDHGRSRIWTRGQQDAAGYFDPSSTRSTGSRRMRAIVDGEVIALDDRGEPDFALLQARIKGKERGGQTTPFVYEVFDLMWLDGRSLLDEPLEVRRSLLKDVLRPDPRVRLSEDIAGEGLAFFRAAQERGLEGRHGQGPPLEIRTRRRTMAWQKIKIRPEQELVVGGWAKGTGKAVELGSLVGVYEDGRLRYAGKVGAGFNDAIRADLLAAMANLATDEQPFAEPPPRPVSKNALWLKPQLSDPSRVRRVDRRRPRPAGGLQGLRPGQGSAQGAPGGRAPSRLGTPEGDLAVELDRVGAVRVANGDSGGPVLADLGQEDGRAIRRPQSMAERVLVEVGRGSAPDEPGPAGPSAAKASLPVATSTSDHADLRRRLPARLGGCGRRAHLRLATLEGAAIVLPSGDHQKLTTDPSTSVRTSGRQVDEARGRAGSWPPRPDRSRRSTRPNRRPGRTQERAVPYTGHRVLVRAVPSRDDDLAGTADGAAYEGDELLVGTRYGLIRKSPGASEAGVSAASPSSPISPTNASAPAPMWANSRSPASQSSRGGCRCGRRRCPSAVDRALLSAGARRRDRTSPSVARSETLRPSGVQYR